ncbi:MAG: MBL fold metallo-hydrolase [Chitinivorax sp.]
MQAEFEQLSAIDYPFGERLPQPGEPVPVAEGIFWLRLPLPFALNHINLWLLRDGDGWTLVDTGYGSRDNIAIWQRLLAEALGGLPLRRIVVTHDHPDHIGLAQWLIEQTGATLWISAPEYLEAHAVWHETAGYDRDSMAELFRRHGVPLPALEPLRARGNNYRHGVKSLATAFQRILPGAALQIDGREWRCIAGYGHSPEHISLHCAELDVLISGDMLLPAISTNISVWASEPDGDPLRAFLDSLARFEPLPPQTLVLPSHGKPFNGIQPRVAFLRQHHSERLDALRHFCDQPRTALECLPQLFDRELDAYQTFFAVGEAIAHLNYLWRAGELHRDSDAAGIHRFVRML